MMKKSDPRVQQPESDQTNPRKICILNSAGKTATRLAAVLAILGFGLNSAHAADRTWNGSVSGVWLNTSNWDGGVVPSANDTAILVDGAVNKTINLGGATRNIQALELDSGVAYTINNGTMGLTNLTALVGGGSPTHLFSNNFVQTSPGTWRIDESQTVNVSGVLNSGEGLTKTGLGTLIQSGDNDMAASNVSVSEGDLVLQGGSAHSDSAVLTVNSLGTLRLEADEAIGGLDGSGAVALDDYRLTVTGGATFDGSSQGSTSSRFTHDGSGAQVLSGAANLGRLECKSGSLDFAGGSFTATASDPYSLLVEGDSTVEISGGAIVDLPDFASVPVPAGLGALRGGSLLITDSGSELRGGRIDISGTESPSLHVENGGFLNITEGDDPGIYVAFSNVASHTGTLQIESGGQVASGRVSAGIRSNDDGTISVTGQGSSLSAQGSLFLGHNAEGEPDGTGRLIITDGATGIFNPAIYLNSSSSSITVDGGTLTFGGFGIANGVTPTIEISDPAAGSALIIGANDTTSTLAASIIDAAGGPGSIEKVGAGTLTLAANQPFSGGVLVTEGTLRLQDAARQFASLTGDGDVVVGNGARLDGTGVIAGLLVAQSGATIEPSDESGSDIGAIDCAGLDVQSGATLEIEIGGLNQLDRINVSGAVSLSGTLQLSYANGFSASDGDTFEIMSPGTITGDFEAVTGPGGHNWVSYQADGSLFVKVCDDPATCIASCVTELDHYAAGSDVLSSISDGVIVVVNRGSAGLEILAAPAPTFGSPLATISGAVFPSAGVKALALDGDRLFVAGGAPRIYDVSDPANPALLATINGYFAWDVAVQGDLLAVAHDSGLALFDISDPANPVLRSDTAQFSEDTGNVKFHNGLLYWNWQALPQGDLVIVDVADPAAPAQLGSIASAQFASEPQFDGDVAIIGSAQGVKTVDVSDPANPVQIGFLSSNNLGAGDVALEGALLYRAEDSAGVGVYDVSNPASPVQIDTLSSYGGAYGLTSVDGRLYISRYGTGGLSLVDVADPDVDGRLGSCDLCNGDDAAGDTDGDGVCDDLDACPGFDDALDADGDGVPDGCDICPGGDDGVDSDADGVPDGCDACPGFDDALDADGDSVPDDCDICAGSDDNVDTDGDGLPDGCDNCPNVANPDQLDSEGPDPALSPVAAWRFEEGVGTTATDTVGANDGALGAPFWATGRYGTGITLNGTTDSAVIPDDDAIDFDTADTFTVAAWIKAPAQQVDLAGVDNNIIEKWSTGSPYPFVIRIRNETHADDGHIRALRFDGTNAPEVQSVSTLNDDQWHHVAFVRDAGGMLRLYVDGVEEDAAPDTTVNTTVNNSPLYLGQRGNVGRFFAGSIDEVAIFAVPLSPSEIADIAAIGLGDGVGDACDLCNGNDASGDSDGDVVCDDLDVCPGFDDNIDSDGDGIPDACDPCPGFPMTVTTAPELIDALNCANAESDANTIFLDDDIVLTTTDNDSNGNNGLPVIASPIVIEGQGHVIERDAGAVDEFRFFRVQNGDLTIVDATLRNGVSGIAVGGGAVLVSTGALHMTNSSLSNNSGSTRGGAITLIGANSSATFDDVLFVDNIASGGSNGGAIDVINAAQLTVQNSTFVGNQAANTGGAISIESTDADATIVGCVFSGNGNTGGSTGGGGGVYNNGLMTMVNCTVGGNRGHRGGGVRNGADGVATLANCLVWGNIVTINNGTTQLYNDGTMNVSFTGVTDGLAGIGGAGTVNDLGGNLTLTANDDVFVEPIDPALAPTTAGDYRLVPGAPGIDAADDDAYIANGGGATDLDGASRTVDACTADTGSGAITYLDMGAYELQSDGPDADGDGVPDACDECPGFDDTIDTDGNGIPDGCDAPCGNLQRGDVDGNGVVEFADAGMFSAIMLDPTNATAEELCAADANEDGNADGRDIQGFMTLLLAP